MINLVVDTNNIEKIERTVSLFIIEFYLGIASKGVNRMRSRSLILIFLCLHSYPIFLYYEYHRRG